MLVCYLVAFALFSWMTPLSAVHEPLESTAGFSMTPDLSDNTAERGVTANNLIFLNRIRLTCLWISFLLSATLTIPLSTFAVQIVSDPYWIQSLADKHYAIFSWSGSLMAAHFLAEGVLRLALWRTGRASGGILIVHHLGFYLAMGLTIGSRHVGVFKIAHTLQTMWAWEWPLYLIFATVRLMEGRLGNMDASAIKQHDLYSAYCIVVRQVSPIGIAVYVTTRILGATVLVFLATCGCRDWIFWFTLSVSVVLVALQVQAGFELLSFRERRLLAMKKRGRRVEAREEFEKPTASLEAEDTEPNELEPSL